ncbi:rho GTPase-activating protein 32-like [Coturnix japonica]|uniref:rho GTPase-activating protein 32-like n=1 Tax=Coturnix japonica TaxID=93934 RepID=UPI000776D9F5|nr:rho GTPase-activating protein 32-like [Coturnix japonica]XP_015732644.1 rho GTPase-activating protein 32-like [Coturnix japonica]
MGAACSGISREPELAATEADNMREPQLVRAMSSLNVPAIAAAHVIRSHVAQGPDELSLEVGDIVCIVDMPPKEMSPFWRGKRGFEVGFFPGECVELIRGKLPESILHSLPKPEPKKRGKFISCLRSLLKACPRRAKQPEPPTFSGSMSLLDIVERMSSPSKRAESAACSWRSCFCLGKPSPVAKRQLQSSAREPSEAEVLVLAGDPSPCISPRRQACYDAASCDSINERTVTKHRMLQFR